MIQARHLRKRFGSVEAVRDISFTAADGCITGLLGQNGAGKTTTLMLTCGLVVPDAGTVAVGADPHGSHRRQLGAVLDHKGLYDRLTARENIAYFGRLHGLEGKALDARVETVVEVLGLQPIADRRTAGFSQGQRMKVALGRAIVHAPTHVLLDEPTNGLDIPSVHALRDMLRRMRDRGTCIVFSSHVLEHVQALCDTVVIIANGRVVAEGDTATICRHTDRRTLEDAFLALSAPQESMS
jgi:sodium transport system ATP-binding protein